MKIKTIKPKIYKEGLRPRKGKAYDSFRDNYSTCPICLSTLKVTKEGYECTGDRLLIWKETFKSYNIMSQEQKDKYLKSLENPDKFLELYDKRDNLDCGYSANYIEIKPNYVTEIPDPLVVTRIEKSLNRKLQPEELEEGFIFYKNEFTGSFSTFKQLPHDREFIIPRVKFPEEV